MIQSLKKIPYKLDILILTIMIIISIIECVHISILDYRAGLSNTHSISFIYVFYYEPLKIVAVLIAIVRIFLNLKHSKELRKCITTALLSILIFFGSFILPFTCLPPGAVIYLKGFEKWVSKNVDINSIQTWILSEEADKYLGQRYENGNYPTELPDFITNFDPLFINFHGQESEKGRCIEFIWGSGISGLKGIVVGSPEMKTMQKGVIKHSDSYYEFRRSIKPGVYIFNAG